VVGGWVVGGWWVVGGGWVGGGWWVGFGLLSVARPLVSEVSQPSGRARIWGP
jgi:hypothetical protein